MALARPDPVEAGGAFRGAALMVVSAVSVAVLNYAINLMLGWTLPVGAYGQVGVAQTLIFVCVSFLQAGFPWVVARAVAAGTDGWRAYKTGLAANTLLTAALVAGLWLTFRAGWLGLDASYGPLLVLVGIVVIGLGAGAVPNAALQGLFRFGRISVARLAEVVVNAVVSVGLVLLGFGAVGALTGFAAAALLVCAAYIWFVRDAPLRHTRGWSGVGLVWSAFPVTMGVFGMVLLTNLDLLGVKFATSGASASDAAAGTYQAAAVLARAPLFVSAALVDAFYPRIAREAANAPDKRSSAVTLLRWIAGAVLPMNVIMLAGAPAVLAFFFPARFAEAEPVLTLLAVSVGCLSLANGYVAVLQAMHKARGAAIAMITAIGVELLAVLWLVPIVGPTGAAVGSLVASIIALAVVTYTATRAGLILPHLRRHLLALGCLAIMVAPLHLVDNRLIVAAWIAAAVLVYGLVCCLLGLLDPGMLRSLPVIRQHEVLQRMTTLLPSRATSRSEPTVVLSNQRPDRPFVPLRAIALAGACVAVLVASYFLASFRSLQSVDLRADEGTYAIESVALQRTGITQWDGAPFLVHPPLAFLVQGTVDRLQGIGYSPLFDRLLAAPYRSGEPLLPSTAPDDQSLVSAILVGRELSAVYGAVTAVLLLLIGRRLVDMRVGLVAAALFTIDPYTTWMRHLNLLEPLVGLLGVAAASVYLLMLGQHGWRRRFGIVAAGLLLGLALLAKELALAFIPIFVIHWLLFRRARLRDVFLLLMTAALTYVVFPVWAAMHGTLSVWSSTRLWLFGRLTGQIQDSGVTRPGSSILSTLLANLADYAPWFALLALAGLVAVVFLYAYFRRGLRTPAGEFVTSSVIGLYAFFAFVWKFGGVLNEQFFYVAMPFVALAVAYGVVSCWRSPGFARQVGWGFACILVALSLYNLGNWGVRYGSGRDDSYLQVDQYLASSTQPGAVVIGRDIMDMYLLPRDRVYSFGYLDLVGQQMQPSDLQTLDADYVVLNEQSLLQQYGGANAEFYEFVQANERQLLAFQGRLYATRAYSVDP